MYFTLSEKLGILNNSLKWHFQFSISNDDHLYQRSADMLLVKIIAHALHPKLHTFGDAHIYLKQVLNRATEASRISPVDPKDTIQWMESLTCHDFKVEYQSMSYIAVSIEHAFISQ